MKKYILLFLFITLSFIAKAQIDELAELRAKSGGRFGLMIDTLLRGGVHVGLADTNARNGTDSLKRKPGMWVITLNNSGSDGVETIWQLQALSSKNGSNWQEVFQIIAGVITFNGFNTIGGNAVSITKTVGLGANSALFANTYSGSGSVTNIFDLQATNSSTLEYNGYHLQGDSPRNGGGNHDFYFVLPDLGGEVITDASLNGNFYPAYLTSLKMDSLLTISGTQWSVVWDSVSHVFKRGKISGSGSSGTVTSINAGFGLTGGTVTTTGTFKADTTLLQTIANFKPLGNSYWAPKFAGTGYSKFSSGSLSYITSIPNSDLTNNTISGVSLGGTLFGHSAGYGITGSMYNGSAIQTWIVDTTHIQTILNFFPKGDTRWLKSSSAASTYVPFTGSPSGVNLNTQTFEAGQFGVGTGTTTPIGKIQTVETSTSTPRGVLFDQYSTDASGSKLSLRKARGTFGSPTTVVTGDNLGGFNGTAFDGTNFIDASRFLTSVTGTVSTGITPGIMSFQNQNAAGALVTGMQMTSDSIHAYIPLNIKSSDSYKAVMQRSSTSTGFSLSNATIGVSGPGNALGFNSAMSQYFQFSDASLPTGNFTGSLSCWVKRTGTNVPLLTYGTVAAGQLIIINVDATDVIYYNGQNNTLFATTAFTLNTYHHLVMTIAAGTIKVYVDGSLIGTNSTTINIVKSGTGIAGDYSPLSGYPDGIIDQYAFYSGTALSATDVTNIYNGGAATAILPGSPLIRFDLDDGAPATTLANTGTATSSNGTTFNSPTWQGFGNGKVPIAGSSIPSLNPVIRSVNGVNQSESGQNFFGLNSGASILTGLNNGVLTSDGNYISVWNSNGMLVDQSNMTLVPTITSQFQLGAGIAAAGGSALKMNTAGSDLTTPETGAWEPNNGRLAYTPSSTRKRVLLSNDVAPTNGQIPIGNGTDLTMATITGANGITVANGSGSITITNGFRSHTIFTPTTGGTVALVVNQYNIINPSGALLALTVNLPSSPANNDVVYIKFTQTISTVTYGNGTVVDGISGPISGGLVILAFDSSSNSWY